VGAANGSNPISIMVPCHRVIGSSGKLVGYGGGLPLKKRLLDLERQAPLRSIHDLVGQRLRIVHIWGWSAESVVPRARPAALESWILRVVLDTAPISNRRGGRQRPWPW